MLTITLAKRPRMERIPRRKLSSTKVADQRIDPEAYRERLGRIEELFSSMIDTAMEVSTRRCPYKNRFDQCTAAFGCRSRR